MLFVKANALYSRRGGAAANTLRFSRSGTTNVDRRPSAFLIDNYEMRARVTHKLQLVEDGRCGIFETRCTSEKKRISVLDQRTNE